MAARAIIKTLGKQVLGGALSGFSRFAAHSFELGSGSGYTPDPETTAPNGVVVYSGAGNLVQARMLDPATVRYIMAVPEGVGPFQFGSVLLYASGFDGSRVPFIEVAFPLPVVKTVADPQIGGGAFPAPGSRLFITVTIKSSVTEADGAISVTVSAPAFANLPYYADELLLPTPGSQPWNQFILHTHTAAKTPVLVTKRADLSYWGMPFAQNIRSPRFGYIDGGVGGDGYAAETCGWVYGQTYRTPGHDFQGAIGGYAYTGPPLTSTAENTAGGMAYKLNP